MVFRKLYYEPDAVHGLTEAMKRLFPDGIEVIFLCIGTDKHILDCLGPLAGTMIKHEAPHITVYGTLEDPLHARNLVPALREIRKAHPGALEVAVDACLGKPEEIGLIQVKEGSLNPGKALNKALPAIGHVSVTGTVAAYEEGNNGFARGSIAPVYHIARAISRAIGDLGRPPMGTEDDQ